MLRSPQMHKLQYIICQQHYNIIQKNTIFNFNINNIQIFIYILKVIMQNMNQANMAAISLPGNMRINKTGSQSLQIAQMCDANNIGNQNIKINIYKPSQNCKKQENKQNYIQHSYFNTNQCENQNKVNTSNCILKQQSNKRGHYLFDYNPKNQSIFNEVASLYCKFNKQQQNNASLISKQSQQKNSSNRSLIQEQQCGKNNILLQVIKLSHKNKTKSQAINQEDSHCVKGEKRQNPQANKIQQQLIPQPLSSDQQISNQAQYLSYIQNPQAGNKQQNNPQIQSQEKQGEMVLYREKLLPYEKQEFLSILYQAIVYMRKQDLRTKIDDQLLADRVIDHIIIGTNPSSRSQIGKSLLKNGYFISAYAVLMGRINCSHNIMTYVFQQYLQNINQIQQNLQQLEYYAQQPVQIFNIPQHKNIEVQMKHDEYKKQNENMKRSKLRIYAEGEKQNSQEQAFQLNIKRYPMKSTNTSFNRQSLQSQQAEGQSNNRTPMQNKNDYPQVIKKTQSQYSPDC